MKFNSHERDWDGRVLSVQKAMCASKQDVVVDKFK